MKSSHFSQIVQNFDWLFPDLFHFWRFYKKEAMKLIYREDTTTLEEHLSVEHIFSWIVATDNILMLQLSKNVYEHYS